MRTAVAPFRRLAALSLMRRRLFPEDRPAPSLDLEGGPVMRFCVPFVVLGPVMAAVLAPVLAATAHAENSPTGWIADAKTGCKIWDAAPDPDEKITWSGACAAGMAEGTGTLQLYVGDAPGARYEGDMRNGRADGHGINTLPDGTRYEGAWRNNAAHGLGA